MRARTLTRLLLPLACTAPGCGGGTFANVDFDYTSLTYIEPAKSIVDVHGDPETIAFKLSSIVREAGARILLREQLDEIPVVPEEGERCYEAAREVSLDEFEAYRANDFGAYDDLDRDAIYAKHGVSRDCWLVKIEKKARAKAWLIKAELDARSASTSFDQLKSFGLTVDNRGIPTSASAESEVVTKTIDFTSRIIFHVWRDEAGNSHVLVKAFPTQGTVEACNTCYIGHDFWPQITAERERDLANNYISLIEELDRAGAFAATPARPAAAPATAAPPAPQPAKTAVCVPGQSITCAGPNVCQGFQVCADDGARFGACQCATP